MQKHALSTVRIGLVQMKMDQDPLFNIKKAATMVRRAAEKGAQIVCLPELYRTRYFPQFLGQQKKRRRLAETIPGGPTSEIFAPLAQHYGIEIIAPTYERQGKNFFNSAVVINSAGEVLPPYRKVHIPRDRLFWEQEYFSPGQKFQIYNAPWGKFAVLICYDQWFPEAARQVALSGAEIIFYPTAIGTIAGVPQTEGDWHAAWETVQRSHAIVNGVCVAAINRVGKEDKLKFWGQSFVSDAFGTVLKRAGRTKEQVLVVSVDLSLNNFVKDGWMFLKHRRPEMYHQ